VAERSGNTAFERTGELRSLDGRCVDESGVALRLPPHSKATHYFAVSRISAGSRNTRHFFVGTSLNAAS